MLEISFCVWLAKIAKKEEIESGLEMLLESYFFRENLERDCAIFYFFFFFFFDLGINFSFDSVVIIN